MFFNIIKVNKDNKNDCGPKILNKKIKKIYLIIMKFYSKLAYYELPILTKLV